MRRCCFVVQLSTDPGDPASWQRCLSCFTTNRLVKGLTPAELALLHGVFRHHPEITAIKLFGSRAQGSRAWKREPHGWNAANQIGLRTGRSRGGSYSRGRPRSSAPVRTTEIILISPQRS